MRRGLFFKAAFVRPFLLPAHGRIAWEVGLAEPVSSVSAAAVGVTSGVVLATLRSQLDPGMVAGIICGAVLFFARSTESSRWRKVLYFVISIVSGHFVAVWAVARWPSLSPFVAGFATAASTVTIAVIALNWIEANVAPILDDLRVRWLGKGGKSRDDSA